MSSASILKWLGISILVVTAAVDLVGGGAMHAVARGFVQHEQDVGVAAATMFISQPIAIAGYAAGALVLWAAYRSRVRGLTDGLPLRHAWPKG